MGIHSKLIVTCFAILLSANLIGHGIRGPKGPQGPMGPRGEIGEVGEVGPNEKFPPAYATAYLNHDAPLEELAILPGAATQIIPFKKLGDHSSSITLNCSTHELSIPSGVYKVSYQFNIRENPAPAPSSRPEIRSIFMTLIPTVGTPSSHPIDFVRSHLTCYGGYPYLGEGIITVPDDTTYKATLSFLKEAGVSCIFGDEAVGYTPQPPCLELNNYARITVVKIAEYQQP